MGNWNLLKKLGQGSKSGFTMIELLVVVAIIGILGAIAGPSWLAFTLQQRVSAANDEIYRAIREAQSEAKQLKQARGVSFRVNDKGEAEYALHDGDVNAKDVSDLLWKQLGEEQGIKANQILLWTNMVLGDENKETSIGDAYPEPTKTGEKEITIQFDQYGKLDENTEVYIDTASGIGLTVAVSAPRFDDAKKGIESTNRCVIIKTILGGVQTKQGTDCRAGS